MQLISSVTVGAGGAATVTFSSIPQIYTDLVLLLSARNTSSGAENAIAQLNATTTGYSNRFLQGNGSVTSSASTIGATNGLNIGLVNGTSATANTFSNLLITIPNYAITVTKTCSSDAVTENNASSAFQVVSSGSSSVTAAVTSLDVKLAFGSTYAENTIAYLYGILKGSGGATVS